MLSRRQNHAEYLLDLADCLELVPLPLCPGLVPELDELGRALDLGGTGPSEVGLDYREVNQPVLEAQSIGDRVQHLLQTDHFCHKFLMTVEYFVFPERLLDLDR